MIATWWLNSKTYEIWQRHQDLINGMVQILDRADGMACVLDRVHENFQPKRRLKTCSKSPFLKYSFTFKQYHP